MKQIKTLGEFKELLKDNQGLIVVDFTAQWCGPCKMIAPYFEELAGQFTDVVFVKVDVDENDETAAECGITAMPTFQCFKGGVKVDDMTGASKDKLLAMVQKNL